MSDVAKIYQKFLKNNYPSGVYDVGTGQGNLIKNLIDFVNIDNKKIIHKKNIIEISRSIADTKKITKKFRWF